MMQEMYEWYMENLFGEHYKIAVKHAEKDGRDRKKRIAKGGSPKAAPIPITLMMDADWVKSRMFSQYDGNYSGRSKWERIGKPFMLSQVDWAITLNPWDFAPGHQKRRVKALFRNYERYEEASN